MYNAKAKLAMTSDMSLQLHVKFPDMLLLQAHGL